jgi:hypothetical protein
MSHADGIWLSKSTFILPDYGLKTLVQPRKPLQIKVPEATK